MTSKRGSNTTQALVDALSQALADSYVLLLKTQNVHWNVTGALFKPVHDLTQVHYEELFIAIDLLAERIRTLGAPVPSSLEIFQKRTHLTEFDKILGAEKSVAHLAKDNAAVAASCRTAAQLAAEIGDRASEDLMIGRIAVHEKNHWMLSAFSA